MEVWEFLSKANRENTQIKYLPQEIKFMHKFSKEGLHVLLYFPSIPQCHKSYSCWSVLLSLPFPPCCKYLLIVSFSVLANDGFVSVLQGHQTTVHVFCIHYCLPHYLLVRLMSIPLSLLLVLLTLLHLCQYLWGC